MPNNKVKTLKSLQGKKSGATLHPHSRRAKQLERVALRTQKLDHQQKHFKARQSNIMERHLHFIDALPDETDSVALDTLHALVKDYIARNDQELEKLDQERQARTWRKAEAKSKKQVELEKVKATEEAEYRTGFVVPDLTDGENLRACREWARVGAFSELPGRRGDPGFVSRLRLIAIFSQDLERVSTEHDGVVSKAEGSAEGMDVIEE